MTITDRNTISLPIMKKVKQQNIATILLQHTHQDNIRIDYDLKYQQARSRLNTFNKKYYLPFLNGSASPIIAENPYSKWVSAFKELGLFSDENTIENQNKLITSPNAPYFINRGSLKDGIPCEWYCHSIEEYDHPKLLATARAILLGVDRILLIKLMECGIDMQSIRVDRGIERELEGRLAYFNQPSLLFS